MGFVMKKRGKKEVEDQKEKKKRSLRKGVGSMYQFGRSDNRVLNSCIREM